MGTLILTLHVVACIVLVVLVLLQSGKEGMGVIFGGGSSSLFGSSGAGSILVKLTAFIAVLFIVTSLSYNVITSAKSPEESVVDKVNAVQIDEPPAPQTAPPAEPPAPAENSTVPAQ